MRSEAQQAATRRATEAAAEKRRASTHCKRGHRLAGANLYVRPDRPGRRECLTCRRDYPAPSFGDEDAALVARAEELARARAEATGELARLAEEQRADDTARIKRSPKEVAIDVALLFQEVRDDQLDRLAGY